MNKVIDILSSVKEKRNNKMTQVLQGGMMPKMSPAVVSTDQKNKNEKNGWSSFLEQEERHRSSITNLNDKQRKFIRNNR